MKSQYALNIKGQSGDKIIWIQRNFYTFVFFFELGTKTNSNISPPKESSPRLLDFTELKHDEPYKRFHSRTRTLSTSSSLSPRRKPSFSYLLASVLQQRTQLPQTRSREHIIVRSVSFFLYQMRLTANQMKGNYRNENIAQNCVTHPGYLRVQGR